LNQGEEPARQRHRATSVVCWLWLVFSGFACVAVVPAARADDAHHRSNLLGDRALGMGGAWTGLADDPSAAYYNPAGLGTAARRSLSASMQLDGFEHVKIDSALEGISDANLALDQRVTIPVFVWQLSTAKRLLQRGTEAVLGDGKAKPPGKPGEAVPPDPAQGDAGVGHDAAQPE
jgi:hypothetical protein